MIVQIFKMILMSEKRKYCNRNGIEIPKSRKQNPRKKTEASKSRKSRSVIRTLSNIYDGAFCKNW